MSQSPGALMLPSMMSSPQLSTLMKPVLGFLIEGICPLMVAFTSLYSNARSASAAKVSAPDMPRKKRIIKILIFAIVAGALIYAAYILGLQARLPKGIIWKLFK